MDPEFKKFVWQLARAESDADVMHHPPGQRDHRADGGSSQHCMIWAKRIPRQQRRAREAAFKEVHQQPLPTIRQVPSLPTARWQTATNRRHRRQLRSAKAQLHKAKPTDPAATARQICADCSSFNGFNDTSKSRPELQEPDEAARAVVSARSHYLPAVLQRSPRLPALLWCAGASSSLCGRQRRRLQERGSSRSGCS